MRTEIDAWTMLSLPDREVARILRRDVLEARLATWRFAARAVTWSALAGGLGALVGTVASW